MLQDSAVVDNKGKTEDWEEEQEFRDLSVSEKIRFHARKEIKKPRGCVNNPKLIKFTPDTIGTEPLDIEALRWLGKEYLSHLEGKKILLSGVKKSEDGGVKKRCVFLRCESLLHKNYAKKLLRRFHKLDSKTGVGITLTLKRENYASVYRDLKKIKRCLNILRLHLRKKYPHWSGNYFCIIEVGKKRHMVHMHMILFGLKYVSHKWLSETWHKITGDSYVVYCSKPHHPKKATSYIYKYLAKNLRKNGDIADSVLLVWASGLRLWSCSRELFEWLGTSSRKLGDGWEWTIYLTKCGLEGCYEIEKSDYG